VGYDLKIIMRTKILFDNVSASVAHTSEHINFEQRAEWMLQVHKNGTNGNPKIIVEYSVDNDELIWNAIENPKTCDYFFLVDEDSIGIKSNHVQGKFLRVRLDPNGTTAGSVKVDLGYKTHV
jgi:hypothetical protein